MIGFIRKCRLKNGLLNRLPLVNKGLLNSCFLNNALVNKGLLNNCLVNNALLNKGLLNNRRLNDYCLCFNRVLFVVKALLQKLIARLFGTSNRLA